MIAITIATTPVHNNNDKQPQQQARQQTAVHASATEDKAKITKFRVGSLVANFFVAWGTNIALTLTGGFAAVHPCGQG